MPRGAPVSCGPLPGSSLADLLHVRRGGQELYVAAHVRSGVAKTRLVSTKHFRASHPFPVVGNLVLTLKPASGRVLMVLNDE